MIPEPAASPGPVPAVAPSSVAGGCGGLRAGSPLAPGEEARGRRSSRATGPPRRPSLGPARDTAPNFPPGSLACSITLPPRALASSRDARPVPEVSPRFGCPMLGRDIAPGRGHCPRQGSGAGGDPRHRWGLWLRRPVPRRNTESIPLLKGGSHPPDPNSNGFLHPQNTRLISQKPQTFKEELGGEIKKEKKKERVYNDFTSPDGLQKNLCAFIFAHSSGSDLLYNYVTFYLLCRGISTQLCLSQLSLGFL